MFQTPTARLQVTECTMQPEGPGSSRKRLFFRFRLAVLLSILAAVALWGYRDMRQRRSRTEWVRTLDVAVVLLSTGNVDSLAVELFEQRLAHLESVLGREFRRYRN